MTLDQACRSFCDMIHVIGTTKSHQKEKGGITCDRFRVALKLTARITDIKAYRHTMSKVIARYPADPAPKDAARFFFPCLSVVSSSDEGYTEDPQIPPADEYAIQQRRDAAKRAAYQMCGHKPTWLAAFLATGRLCKAGRNQTVYAAAVELKKLGHTENEALSLIAAAPFSRIGFADLELTRTVRSGFRRS